MGDGVQIVAAKSIVKIGRRRRIYRPVDDDVVGVGALIEGRPGSSSGRKKSNRRVARQTQRQRRHLRSNGYGRDDTRTVTNRRRDLFGRYIKFQTRVKFILN